MIYKSQVITFFVAFCNKNTSENPPEACTNCFLSLFRPWKQIRFVLNDLHSCVKCFSLPLLFLDHEHIFEYSMFLKMVISKVQTFWEVHIIWKKSSSWFGRLLSKCTNHEEDFFQILCVSQKVQTLILKEFLH